MEVELCPTKIENSENGWQFWSSAISKVDMCAMKLCHCNWYLARECVKVILGAWGCPKI